MTKFERQAQDMGYRVIAGIDEVGRGPLAGPVVAAAVVMPLESPKSWPSGIKDSKRLTPGQRTRLDQEIRQVAVSLGIAAVDEAAIDKLNILKATRLAMGRAIAQLDPQPDYLLIDAVSLPGVSIPQQPIIKGDTFSISIAAASIVAKVYRDQLMCQYHERYPQYGFNRHMGYPTPAHLAALQTYGPCPIHRRSFRGVPG